MKILIVAGGTGGHLYPGLALARVLKGHDVRFVVRRGDLGQSILKDEGFPIQEISGQGLPRSVSLKILTFPFKLAYGWVESWSLLRQFRPDWVVGMGGYLSVPVIVTARLLGVKTLLHEQNVFPGLANRLLSRWVNSVAVSFPESASHFKVKVWVSGLPIRPEIGQADKITSLKSFGLKEGVPTYLIFGGSLGARQINTLAPEAWKILLKKNIQFQVIHITGSKEFERIQSLYAGLSVKAKVIPYCDDMAAAYAAADGVVCRAGASTIAELLAIGLPALVVPYPFASNNHQVYNAQILEKSGRGKTILDETLTPTVIADFLSGIKGANTSPAVPSTSAAAKLAAHLL